MGSPLIATFSIVARDPANGDLGVAVQSKFLAVGSVVPWARAHVGAIATQSLANLSYGPDGLALLEQGVTAADVVRQLIEADPQREHRQVGIVDREGRAAAYTGSACHPWAGQIVGEGFCCQGNILANESVIAKMAETFCAAEGELAERMLAALEAGQTAGGDRRGRQSASLYVVREGGAYGGVLDRYIDLRVDDHPDPIKELTRLLQLHRFYLTRPAAEDLIPIDKALAGELQDTLRELGYYSGPNTNSYDEVTREALFAYGGIENLEERLVEDARIDKQVLDFIRRKREEAKNRKPK
ncbi:MAG: DUF1028 domain-containing protein [Chloroflexi bacterium]|nr:DUF1028 domain-containing protein [Chloroflexota bacterium]